MKIPRFLGLWGRGYYIHDDKVSINKTGKINRKMNTEYNASTNLSKLENNIHIEIRKMIETDLTLFKRNDFLPLCY